jgi:hypothetical protein
MSCNKTFVELDKTLHDRPLFDCGAPEINAFLKQYALRHMKVGISKTMVLPASERQPNRKFPICSFYTVAPSSIRRETLPPDYSKRLPHYPIPVFLIAQLGVDKRFQKQQLGKLTLIKALHFLWQVNHKLRAYAVVVDCLNVELERFYGRYGFQPLYRAGGKSRMFIPMNTVEQLF